MEIIRFYRSQIAFDREIIDFFETDKAWSKNRYTIYLRQNKYQTLFPLLKLGVITR